MTYIESPLAGLGGGISWRPPARLQLVIPVNIIAEYQNAVQRLCGTSALNVDSDSAEVATGQQSQSLKLAARMMLRSLPFSSRWTMRLGRLHAFLAKHCTQYAKTCLAVRPPSMLNLSAFDHSADLSDPLPAVAYLGNLFTTADGSVYTSVFCDVITATTLISKPSPSLSVLIAIFPGEPGLASFIGAKDDRSGGDNWSYIGHAKLKSNVIANKPTHSYFQAGRPSYRPTDSVKARKGIR